MTSLPRFALLSATALTLSPQLASAGPVRGLAEVSIGFASPQSDDGYEEWFTSSVKYGARVGGLVQLATTTGNGVSASASIGLDVGADYTSMALVERRDGQTGESSEDQMSVDRWRLTAGPRIVLASGRALIFARGGVGLDRMKVDFTHLIGALCEDVTLDGLALEGSIGVGARFGHVMLGAQFGASSGDHHDDRPVCAGFGNAEVDVLDNRNLDVDAQLIAGWLF